MIVRTEMRDMRTTMYIKPLRLVLLRLNILLYNYIFLNCVKDNFFSFYRESRWTKISFLIEDIQLL